MKRKDYVIFIPGLGDNKAALNWALRLWRCGGVQAEVYRFDWTNTSAGVLLQKQSRFLDRIDELLARGFRVSLVGISAGGSVVLNAFRERQNMVHAVINICGRLRDGFPNAQPALQDFSNTAPVFHDSVVQIGATTGCISAESRGKILTVRPFFDREVPVETVPFCGAQNTQIMSVCHGLSISVALIFHRHKMMRFLQRQKPCRL